jgi:hypothetical protein
MGKDRIVIVTTDRDFDQRVREALRDEPYKPVTIDDFAAHADELVTTCLGIIDARNDSRWVVLRYIRTSFYGLSYPLLGIVSKREKDVLFGSIYYHMEMSEVYNKSELLEIVRMLIQGSREESDEPYRI